MPAGFSFVCAICEEEHDEDKALQEEGFSGPVCPDCKKKARKAMVWLKYYQMDRLVQAGDINMYNHKRFLP